MSSTSPPSKMTELIEFVAKQLVDNPDQVDVQEFQEDSLVIELAVAESDMGKIIGRQGRTARALRQLLVATSTKLKTRAVLEIVE